MLTRPTFALPLFALLLIVTASIAAAAGVPIQRREGTTSEAADYLCPQTLFTQFLSVPLVSTADPNDADPDAKWIFSLCAADITCGATNAFVSRQYADHCVPLASTLSTVGWVPSLATGVTAVFHGSLVVPNDVVVNVSVACDTDAPMLMSNGPVVKSFASGNATTLFQVWQYDIPLRSMYACPAAAPQTVKFTTMSTDSQALTTIPIALPAGAHQYVVIEPGTSMGLDIVLEVLDSGDNAVCDGPITFDMKRGKPLTPLGPLIDKSIGPAVGNAPSIGGTSSNGDDAPSFSWNGIVSVFASSSMCTDPKQAAIAIHDTGDSIPPPLQLNATSTAVFAWNLANGERNVSAEAKKVLGESGKLAYYVIIESRLDPRKAAGVTCSLNLYVAVHRPGFSVALFVLMVMAFLLMTGVFIFVVRKTWTARAFIRRTDLAVRPPAFPPFHVVLCAIPLLVARSIVLMLKSLALKYHGDVPRRRANSGNGGLRRRAATDEPTPLSGPDMRELDARSSLARSNSSLSPIATASQTTAVPVPSPPAAPAGASTAEEDEKLCRICKEDESQEALIAPCKCTGSIRWMHPSCLAHWRGEAAKRNARYITHCEICQQEFDARLVPKTSVLNLVAARYQFMALCIVVGFVIVMLTGVAVSQGAASVACMDPWHYPWTTFSGVVVLGAAGYLIIHFLLYMAAYSAEREMQALRVAQGQHPRPLAILSEILYPALPKALFAIAYFTVIGYVWLWLLYFSNSNIAWSVEWRVDAGFYWTFVLTTLVLVIADGVAEPTPPADGRGGDPAPLLGGNQQEAVRAPSTVDDVVATDQALNTTRSSLADGSPLIPVAAAATAVLTRVAADTAPMVRESSAVVVDSGRGWRDGGESIDGAMSDRAEEDDEADLVGHHHDAANT